MFHYKRDFIEKAQHLWRWISLRMFTRGRLVLRQPRAIKRTTRTELHHEGIYFAKFIHWDNSATPTQLRDEKILRVALLIIKGEIVKGRQSLSPSPSPKREGSNYSLKWRELFWGYLGVVMLLIMKRKIICVISLCKTWQNTSPFDANYRVKWRRL